MKRNPYWCLYSSSYDRGLEHLLKIWPDVVKAVPKAQLHIFYGWKLFEQFYRDNASSMSWMKKIEKMMEHKGITHHGRVPQPEIEKWHKKCGLWTYPTHFGEINCISAMKAQCWGSIPVVVDYAALKTTVKYGVKIEGDIYEPETQEKYKLALIKSLKDDKWQNELRPRMMEESNKLFSWKLVAKQWSEEFNAKKTNE